MHAQIQKVLSESVQLFQFVPTLTFFLIDEGREDPTKYHQKRALIGPPAKRHLNDCPTLNAGLKAL